jgi:hypothetical protein
MHPSVATILPACDDPAVLTAALLDPVRFDALLAERKRLCDETPSLGLRTWIVYGSLLLTARGSAGPIHMSMPPDGDLVLREDYFKTHPIGGYASFYGVLPTAEMECPGCGCGFDVRDYGTVRSWSTGNGEGPVRLYHEACRRMEQQRRMRALAVKLVDKAGLVRTKVYLAKNTYVPDIPEEDPLPWMRVQLDVGTLLIGYRRSVWLLDYTGLRLEKDLFADAETTHGVGFVHLNQVDRILDALHRIRTALVEAGRIA